MLIGLVGKPSVGKSTFFKAATLAEVAIASYPFTTIKPNHGVGYVKVKCIDKEFGLKCQPNHGFCINGTRFVPVELMDVAGLVPGASEGRGLGNQFLDDLREADAFIHLVDVSGTTDAEGKPAVNYNPLQDMEFLEQELDKWYYNLMVKVWKSFARKVEIENEKFSEAVARQFSGLKVKEEHVKEVQRKLDLKHKPSQWVQDEVAEKNNELVQFASALRKISKPTIIAANKVDLAKGRENYNAIRKKYSDFEIIPCSADFELALREASKANMIDYIPGENNFRIIGNLSSGQKQALEKLSIFLKEFPTGTGVQAILDTAVFKLLDYIAIFPAGGKFADSKGHVLPDCFLLPNGSTALDFAYCLHTDFGKNFIKAIDARTKRALGKDYVLKHRDALEIVAR